MERSEGDGTSHGLLDPSLESAAANIPNVSDQSTAHLQPARFRDKLISQGLALANADRRADFMAQTLDSWQASVSKVAEEERLSVETKVTKALCHGSMPLIDAARRGNMSHLEELLAEPRDASTLDATDAAGMTAMGWAAKRGHAEVVRRLLGACASPDLRLVRQSNDPSASEAQPPLYLALVKGHTDIATLLLDALADRMPAALEPDQPFITPQLRIPSPTRPRPLRTTALPDR
jgi:ankyrin repeat protein